MTPTKAIALLTALFVSGGASALDPWPIHKLDNLVVTVQDNVDGGCWTNVKAVKTQIELILRQSNIKVVENPDEADAAFLMSAWGKRTEGVCFGGFGWNVLRFVWVRVGRGEGYAPAHLWQRTSAAISNSTLNSLILNSTEEVTREFANTYLKGKQEANEKTQ